MAQRTGLTTIRDAACFLATFITASLPAIKKVFPDATDLHNQLELVAAACSALCLAADETLPIGD